MNTCPIHPDYQAIRPPTSTAPGCVCADVYARRNPGAAIDAALGADPDVAAKTCADLQSRLNRANDDLRIARSRVESAEKRMHEAERVREAIFGLKAAPIVAPDWAVERSTASDAPHIPVLLFSDAQWGETISAENMDGINEYSVAVAEARYRKLIERAVDISFEHLPRNRYEGLIYLRGGDMVSGDIHQELRETNELGGVEAIRSLVAAETWGIRTLAEAFGSVHVVSVPGNHGRTSLKPPSKKIAESNYDTLSAWWLESAFRGDARVSWHTPLSTDAVFQMHGRNYLLTHGDNIGTRGGQGFAGPIVTISRGATQTLGEYARRGVMVDKIFMGHFHSAFDFGRGWSNGSLPGYSEYARSYRMVPEPPQQWLLYFCAKYGVTSQWKVQL